MTESIIELKAGKLHFFTEGQYSDYGIIGSFVALRDVSEAEVKQIADYLLKQAAEKRPDSKYMAEMSAENSLVAELLRGGVLLDVDFTEIHVNDFIQKGTFDAQAF